MTGVMTGLPAFSQVNLARMLHGEQYIEIKKPFPTSGINKGNENVTTFFRNFEPQRCDK